MAAVSSTALAGLPASPQLQVRTDSDCPVSSGILATAPAGALLGLCMLMIASQSSKSPPACRSAFSDGCSGGGSRGEAAAEGAVLQPSLRQALWLIGGPAWAGGIWPSWVPVGGAFLSAGHGPLFGGSGFGFSARQDDSDLMHPILRLSPAHG